MGLETAAFVSNLVATNPIAGDTKSQGDDHLRLIKAALQATFPNASRAFYFPDAAAKTVAYSILVTDSLKFLTGDATAGAFAFTLPTLAAGDAGWRVAIMKIDASANAITITGTVNGSANPTLPRRYEAAILWWTGTAWFMARQRPTIDTADITLLAVTTALVNDLAITTAKIADANVTTAKIADLNVTTGKLADASVTNAKLTGIRKTIQYLTAGTAATYTTPANCKSIVVKAIGAGSGGGSGSGAGGNTIFNGVNAAGGNSVSGVGGGLGGTGGTGSASFRIRGSDGSTPAANNGTGGIGGAGLFGMGAGRGRNNGGVTASNGGANTGAGGGGGTDTGGGASGEYFELVIQSPAATYTYTIGAAGAAAGTGGAGGTGMIIVEEYY